VYQRKIADLEELKKSVLQKAFMGKLTISISTGATIAKVISFQKIADIGPTDLQAGITAIALKKHIEQGRRNTFGHVKAEKIVHLAEGILEIDLGRNPIKDAAGPNDFSRVKNKVEPRAALARFYTVAKRMAANEVGYTYTQGSSFNWIINKANNCLGEKAATLSEIIDLLVPMNTKQAEILATLYAAWNNLLFCNENFSDEDIVTEARENWHKEKLNIQREKFFKAIEYMKSKPLLVPKGNGKIIEKPGPKKQNKNRKAVVIK
jgi:hypothetical protein